MGIILYLPPGQNDAGRAAIEQRFREYCQVIEPVCAAYGAKAHWAKIEPRLDDKQALRAQQGALHAAYGARLDEFNTLRAALDPRRVLGNAVVDSLLEHPDPGKQARAPGWEDFRKARP